MSDHSNAKSSLTEPSRKLNSRHLEELRHSGLSDETIERAGLYSASPEQVRLLLGFNASDSPGIAFPYGHLNGSKEPVLTRIKLDTPPIINGKTAKYLSPKGSINHVYLPPGLEPLLKDIAAPLYITEGEKKALKATQEGLCCVGIAGVWGWKTRAADGDSVPLPDLESINFDQRNVFIVFDSDAFKNQCVKKAERMLTKELESRGAVVRIIKLPAQENNKVGLDDFLLTHSVVDLLQLPQDIPPSSSKRRESQGARLVELAEPLELFHDPNKNTFVFLEGEAIPLAHKKLRQWLVRQYLLESGKTPNGDAINQAMAALESKAIYEGDCHELSNRIAKFDEAFWYDMGNGQAVKTLPTGWTIETAPVVFRRYAHQKPQSVPVVGGDPYDVFRFINVGEEQKLLLIVWLISNFIPDIPHPIFHPHGPQGSGKTCLFRIAKKLCDPSSMETLISPKDFSQLVQTINHHHLCLLDNMSEIPHWMSDVLAQSSTGGGFSKRQLYTDDDDIIYQVKRCIGINGINLLISKPDLMDRSILLYLDRIEPQSRKEEAVMWEEFEAAKPGILGGIFDTLAKAKAIYPEVRLKNLPRMADFARWGYAIAEALGLDGNDFIKAYNSNILQQNEEVIQHNTLAQSLITFMASRFEWDGTIKEAYNELRSIANPDKNDPSFPKSNRTLKKLLERIKPNLADHGIKFKYGPRTDKGYTISFQKSAELGSFSSGRSDQLPTMELRNEPSLNQTDADSLGTALCSGLNTMSFNENEEPEANEPNRDH